MKLLSALIFICSYAYANPNTVVNIDAHYDKDYHLVTPDKILLVKAIKSYQDGYNTSAFTRFLQSAAFGNSDAHMYVGLMHIKALGVPRNWAKGYAWIKLAALSHKKKHVELMQNIKRNLKPMELKQSIIEYQEISKNYDISATLKRREAWVKKQRRKSTGSRTGSQISNVRTQNLNGVAINTNMTANLEVMNEFVDEYGFGVVIPGRITPKN